MLLHEFLVPGIKIGEFGDIQALFFFFLRNSKPDGSVDDKKDEKPDAERPDKIDRHAKKLDQDLLEFGCSSQVFWRGE